MKHLLLFLVGLALVAPRVHAAPNPADVDKSIARAKAFIYSTQKDGTWELAAPGSEEAGPAGRHRYGLTALATYALLAAGENPQDPRLVKAVNFLKTADMPSVYALGCRTQIWNLLPPSKETRALATADAQRLIKMIKAGGDARGLFHYPDTPPNTYDMSISQYGVLGLWACDQAGAEIPGPVWAEMDKAWRAHQLKDGAWCYINGAPTAEHSAETPSMTVAGIATLFITHDAVRANQYLACGGNKADDNIARGIEWLAAHFDQVYTGGARGPGAVYYTLYGVERVGVASGYKYFGKTDWFNSGAEFLLKNQQKDGSWGAGGADLFGRNVANMPTTAFALLFMSRGRSPVIVNKLRYEPATKVAKPNWNQRPRDCANLSHWLGRSVEMPLNWQITTLDAPADELLDAPVLYITGSQELKFTPEQEAKLKAFVEDGGMILGNADCGSQAFTKSFVALGQRMFKYEFRELGADHPIFANQQYPWAKFKSKPNVHGLSNETRELMVLMTTDPSRSWQTPYDGRLEPYAIGANVLLYAVDKKGLRNRNVTYVVHPDPAVQTGKTVRLARLSYAGNWDPEPAGWRRMAAILRNQDKVDLKVESVDLGAGKLCQAGAAAAPPEAAKPDAKEIRTRAFKRVPPEKMNETAGDTAKIEALIQAEVRKVEAELAAAAVPPPSKVRNSQYDVAHLTGSAAYTFSPAQVKELRDFVSGGGVLLVDAAGGSGEFANSVEAALNAAFDEAAAALKAPLPADHPLFKVLAETPDVYRSFAKKRVGNSKAPRLRGLTVRNKLAVVYSPEDLTTGLVGQEVDGVTGYTPAAATALVRQLMRVTAGVDGAATKPAGAPPQAAAPR